MARIFCVDSSVEGVVMWSSLMFGYFSSNALVIGSSHLRIASWLLDMTRRILVWPAPAGWPLAAARLAASAGLSAGLGGSAWLGPAAWLGPPGRLFGGLGPPGRVSRAGRRGGGP